MSIAALAHDYVEKNDAVAFRELLSDIPVSDLNNSELESMLRIFLLPCYKFQQKYYCRDVISAFDYDEQLPLLTRLFTFREISDSILDFVISIYNNVGAMEHIDNLSDYIDSENYEYAFRRILNLYPKLLTEEFIMLYNSAIDSANMAMIKLIGDEVSMRNVMAPIPRWIVEAPEGTSLEVPEPPPFPDFEMPSDRVAVKRIQAAFGRLKITGPDEGFRKAYKRKTEEEKRKLMRDVYEQERSDQLFKMTEYNRLIGPRNVEEDGWYDDYEHPCYKYGGHAMLLCICNEDTPEDSDEYAIDWFLGYCIRCKRRFASRVHAIRRPILTGGWVGCFCVDCVDDPSIRFEAEREALDLLELSKFVQILERDKIYNRPAGLILPLPDYTQIKLDEGDLDVIFTFDEGREDQGFEVMELRAEEGESPKSEKSSEKK